MWWELTIMAGPLGDKVYDSIAALVIFLVGAGIWFRTGNRFGWLFMVAAAIWIYLTFQDLLFM